MSFGLFEGFCPIAPDGALDSFGCFVASWEIPILILVGIAVWAIVLLLRRRQAEQEDPGLLILPMGGAARLPEGPSGVAWGSAEEYERQKAELKRALSSIDDEPEPEEAPSVEEPVEAPEPKPTERVMLSPDALRPETSDGVKLTEHPGSDGSARTAEDFDGRPAPVEGTLQLLPGRLEISSGPGSGEEIRFVRIPGVRPEVTIGRLDGPAHRHVKLDSPTVSRTHAKLTFEKGIWTLRNESSTNPTVHNGRALESGLEDVALQDGDQIEVGEVTMVFRQGRARGALPQRSSWYTDRGRRAVNQDAVVVRTLNDGRELAAVCDGMGSHSEGGVASHIALEALVQALTGGSNLRAAIEKAHRAVLDAAAGDPEREGMGTTMVAMLRDGARYEVANVGDSRAYRIRDSKIEQVTRDHSFVAEAVQAGRMTLEEAKQSPWKTAVTRSLGGEETVDVDVFGSFDASEPAIVLLCTDGVHGVVESDAIMELVSRTPDVRDLARAVAEEALLRGGEDNVAAAALKLGSGPGVAGD